MINIEWTNDALEDLNRLDKPIAKRILKKISWYSKEFDNITPEPLSADFKGTFKLRIGDWRIIYTIETDILVIQAVGHRKEIYD